MKGRHTKSDEGWRAGGSGQERERNVHCGTIPKKFGKRETWAVIATYSSPEFMCSGSKQAGQAFKVFFSVHPLKRTDASGRWSAFNPPG